MLTFPLFTQRIERLNTIKSKTGKAGYTAIRVSNNQVYFIRTSTGKTESIKLEQLYKAYQQLDYINTINIRSFIQGRRYSPSCAILIAINAYNQEGVRL